MKVKGSIQYEIELNGDEIHIRVIPDHNRSIEYALAAYQFVHDSLEHSLANQKKYKQTVADLKRMKRREDVNPNEIKGKIVKLRQSMVDPALLSKYQGAIFMVNQMLVSLGSAFAQQSIEAEQKSKLRKI